MKFQIIIFLLIGISVINAQDTYNWQNYTDMKNVRSVQITENGFWAASGGGGFYFDMLTQNFLKLHKNDGLIGSSLKAVTIDNDNKIWFGDDAGAIDVYNPDSKQVKTILDIYNDNEQSNKSINYFEPVGDTIFICTDFGLSLVDSKNYIFFDTFFKYGNFEPYVQVNASRMDGLIYLATSAGVAIQKEGARNLSAPESWNTYTVDDGLPSNNINKVIKYENTVIAASERGLSKMEDSIWTPFLTQFNNTPVKDLLQSGESLYIASGKKIYLYENNSLNIFDSSSVDITKLAYSKSAGIVAATKNGIFDFNSRDFIYPNGPEANQFPELAVDNNGNLWSASGKDVTGVGFYKFDGQIWTNYNRENTAGLITNAFNSIYADDNDEIYLGSWGRGFTRLSNDNIQNFTTGNTPLAGDPESPNFLVISGFSKDSKGNLWVLNYWPGDGQSLSMLTPDSTWYLYSNPAELGQVWDQHYSLAIDPYDTKWYSIRNSNRLGLFYFNENRTSSDSSDNKFGYLTTEDGLNSNFINSVVVDKRGDIWVGTGLGVNIISNNGTVLSDFPQFRISSVFALRQQTINAIAVDPLNNKWIGTNQGLLLVNSDGSSLLATYDTKNSSLLSNEIRSLAIDPNSGRVYVGTDAGLSSFDTPAVRPEESFTELFLYPNPFILNNAGTILTIDGLIKDTDIKILNIEGKLIREFTSPGGRIAFWDGRDESGSLVGSGVYLVVAFDKEGNNVTTSKVAVLHK